jgi:hypothetical protein
VYQAGIVNDLHRYEVQRWRAGPRGQPAIAGFGVGAPGAIRPSGPGFRGPAGAIAGICALATVISMLPLHLTTSRDRPLSVLVIGAHPDDIEIGAGGTLLSLAEAQPGLRARYVVLTGTPDRQEEARNAARTFLPAAGLTIELHDLPEGRLPAAWGQVKDILEAVAGVVFARPHRGAIARRCAPGSPDHRRDRGPARRTARPGGRPRAG